jgi:hypothetical protein
MICTYCHNPITGNAKFCEHCGSAVEYGVRPNQKNRMGMAKVALAFMLFLSFFFDWFTLFLSYIISSSLLLVDIILLFGGIIRIILYILYIKAFKARTWEIVIFIGMMILSFILPFMHISSYYVDFAFTILSTLFIIIFFSLRIRTDRFIWILIIGYFIKGITSITSPFLYKLLPYYVQNYNFIRSFKTFFLLIRAYSNIGSFFLLMYGCTIILRLINNKRLGYWLGRRLKKWFVLIAWNR